MFRNSVVSNVSLIALKRALIDLGHVVSYKRKGLYHSRKLLFD